MNTAESVIARYPRIRMKINVNASGSHARTLGVDPLPRSFVLNIEPEQVSAMMSALEWDRLEKGQAKMAVMAMEVLLNAIFENSAWMSNYRYNNMIDMQDAFKRASPQWRECLEGAASWPEGILSSGAWIESSIHLDTSKWSSNGAGQGDELTAAHKHHTQEFVSTMIDHFSKLGSRVDLVSTHNVSDWSQVKSKLQKWKWSPLGLAVSYVWNDGSAVCAALSGAQTRALALSALGKALGPSRGLALIGNMRGLSPFGSDHTFLSFETVSTHGEGAWFHSVVFAAKEKYRDEPEAKRGSVERAMRDMLAFGSELAIEQLAPELVTRSFHPGLEKIRSWGKNVFEARAESRVLDKVARGKASSKAVKRAQRL